MAQETILVIDDSREMLLTLKSHLLEPMGYKVLTAVDGHTGLQAAVQHDPDLILLDMNLPRMTGLEMLSFLRKTPCTSPVIFMTVSGSEHIAVEAFRMGVRDYLNKPFSYEALQTAIDSALREKRLTLEREKLNHDLLTAEAVRLTMVTLSHYLNNDLMVLYAGLKLLEEALLQKHPDPALLQIVHDSYNSAQGIHAVLQVLQNATTVKLSPYTDTTSIIDIQDALQKALEQLRTS